MLPETVLGLCRFLVYGAAMIAWGVNAYLTVCVPQPLARQIERRLKAINLTTAVIAAVATLALLPVRTALLADGWRDSLSVNLLSDVLFETSIGTAWQIQTCAVGILVAARCVGQSRTAATALAGGLLLASLTMTGHTMMNAGWTGTLHKANDVLHVLAGGAWFGALLPVALLLPQLGQKQPEALHALMQFSRFGHITVLLVLLSGLANTLLILGGLPDDWSVVYQQLLSIKIVLVCGLVVIALANRYVLVPRLNQERATTIKALVFATCLEIILFTVVLGLVAWLGMMDPAGS